MSKPIRISDELEKEANFYSKIEHRSIAAQVEYWAKMGHIAFDNPDLPMKVIKDILISREEAKAGKLISYEFNS